MCPPAHADGASLRYADHLPSTLNPLYGVTPADRRAQTLVFDPLFYRTTDGDFVSRLVEDVKIAPDGVVDLKIRRGVTWHDDAPLVAADVCATVKALRDEAHPTPAGARWGSRLGACRADGERVAIVVRGGGDPREALRFLVLPAHLEADWREPWTAFGARPVGTGPMTGARGRREVRFEPAPSLQHTPPFEEVVLEDLTDGAVALARLAEGRLDGVVPLTAGEGRAPYPEGAWWGIAIAPRGPLADVRVRRAVALGLEPARLAEATIDESMPLVAVSGPFPPGSPMSDRMAMPWAGSREGAREALAAAGLVARSGRWTWRGEPVRLRVAVDASLRLQVPGLGAAVGNTLDGLGFAWTVTEVPHASFGDPATRAAYDLRVGAWPDPPDGDLRPYFAAKDPFDVDDAGIQAALNVLAAAPDPDARAAAGRALHRALAPAAAVVFLWRLPGGSAWRGLSAAPITPDGYFDAFDEWRR